MMSTLLLTLAAVPLCWIALPFAIKRLMQALERARPAGGNAVYLTFDDGPDPRSTPRILDLLEEADARATFFVIGTNVERHPDLVRRIVAAGHALGEHSHAHTHAWKTGPWHTLQDMLKGAHSLREYRDGRPPLLRPPYGKFNPVSLLYALLGGRRVIFWDVDPRDYACSDWRPALDAVRRQLRPGRIILLHDGRRAEGGDVEVTVTLVRELLHEGRRRGLRFVEIGHSPDRRPAVLHAPRA